MEWQDRLVELCQSMVRMGPERNGLAGRVMSRLGGDGTGKVCQDWRGLDCFGGFLIGAARQEGMVKSWLEFSGKAGESCCGQEGNGWEWQEWLGKEWNG